MVASSLVFSGFEEETLNVIFVVPRTTMTETVS